MRKIEFRGIIIGSSEWAFGSLVYSIKEDQYYIVEHSDEEASVPVYKESIGQLTGLKDKNGKDIYEGDVVEMWRSYYRGHLAQFGRHKIVWDDNEPGFTYDNTEYRLTKNHAVAIVGNIHDKEESKK